MYKHIGSSKTLRHPLIILLQLLLLGVQGVAFGATRRALLIGNDSYENLAQLKNAGYDAASMKTTLQKLGFIVKLESNASGPRLAKSITEFVNSIQADDIVLFFYSGHGGQIGNENYLFPTDMAVPVKPDAKLSADKILAEIEKSRSGLNIFILDSCRTVVSRGLLPEETNIWKSMSATGRKQTLIAFATTPGATAADGPSQDSLCASHSGHANGLYTGCLLTAIAEDPKRPVEAVFKRTAELVRTSSNGSQVPWTHSSLTKEFSFLGPLPLSPSRNPPSPPRVIPQVQSQNEDRTAIYTLKGQLEQAMNELLARGNALPYWNLGVLKYGGVFPQSFMADTITSARAETAQRGAPPVFHIVKWDLASLTSENASVLVESLTRHAGSPEIEDGREMLTLPLVKKRGEWLWAPDGYQP
jgi:hypothetical protein